MAKNLDSHTFVSEKTYETLKSLRKNRVPKKSSSILYQTSAILRSSCIRFSMVSKCPPKTSIAGSPAYFFVAYPLAFTFSSSCQPYHMPFFW